MDIVEKNPLISVVIRCKNEQKYLPKVLAALQDQTYTHFEIIIVDDHSQDRTLDIAKQYKCKIVSIPDTVKFSHGYSCNLGASHANGEYIVYLNGHTIPDSRKYLESGLRNFEDPNVAGVYGPLLAHKDGTLADKLLFNTYGYIRLLIKYPATKKSVALLATMSAMIRTSLWQKTHFDEHINWGMGGEDYKRAANVLDDWYTIIHDNKFRARHSHHLKMSELPRQLRNRKKMAGDSKQIPEAQRRHI